MPLTASMLCGIQNFTEIYLTNKTLEGLVQRGQLI